MGERILERMRHYGLFIFIPLALVLLIAAPYIAKLFVRLNTTSGFFRLPDDIFRIPVYVLLIILWAVPFFLYVRIVRYRDKTRRSYIYDSRKYKRTYRELVEYFQDADPHYLDPECFEIASWKDSHGIIFGSTDEGRLVRLPSDAECNIFVSGMMGSSTSSGVVIPTCSQYEGYTLTIDLKGDIYNACHNKRRILRFCPDLTDEKGENIALKNSCSFNPFEGVSEMTETDKKLYISNMAMTLIPDEGGTEGSYFPSRGRKLFIGILYYLMEKKPNITFPEILHAILHKQKPAGVEMKNFPQTVFEWVIAITQSDCTVAIEQVGSLLGNNEKNISGAFDSLTTALAPFSNDILDVLLSGKGRCISPKALEKDMMCIFRYRRRTWKRFTPRYLL